MRVTLTKIMGAFVPSDPETKAWSDKMKIGQVVHADFKKVRNYSFHKKYFALLTVAFDNWEPGEINSKYGVPIKNFDRFRADLTILAGFYENYVRIDGSVRIEPKSISFAKMDEKEFSELYNRTVDVLLKHVYKQDMDAEKLDSIVEQYMSFV